MKKYFPILLLSVFVSDLFGQVENSKQVSGQKTGYSLFYGGIETSTTPYINTDTKDSNRVQLYIAPYLDYNHKSGVGIKVKTYLLPGGSDPGFFLTSISPYFARYTGKLLPYISYTRYLQHDNPSVPYSPLQNEVYAHLRLKTKYINPAAGIDIGFGNDEQNADKSVSDVNAFAGANHLFLLQNLGTNKRNILAIMPGIQLNAGTDRYYKYMRTSNYLSRNTKLDRIGYGNGRGSGGQGSSTQGTLYTISEENDFRLSNFEINAYLMYFLGNFSIEPSGSLYFPLRGDDKSPYGYWQININYWIN